MPSCSVRTAAAAFIFHKHKIHAFYTHLIYTHVTRPNHIRHTATSFALKWMCIATAGNDGVGEMEYFIRNFYDVVDKFYCRQFPIYFAETTIKIWNLINDSGVVTVAAPFVTISRI